MNVLIISTSDQRKRHIFISEPLYKIKNIKSFIFKNESNIIVYIYKSLQYAYRKRDFSFVIILGSDFKGVLWTLLTKVIIKSKIILRLGGDPFKVRKKAIKIAITKKKILRYVKLNLNYLLTKIIFCYTDTIVVVNQSLVTKVNRQTKNNKKIFVIPQTVKIPKITHIKSNTLDDKLYLLTVTNLSYEDKFIGVKNIIEYLILKNNEHGFSIDIIFNILGGGYYLEDLKQFLKEVKINSERLNINVEGYVDNPSKFYEDADIFIYCSTLDSTPNVLLEAQSYGLPLLVNSYEPFHWLLQEYKNALFFDEKNGNDFYRKLIELIKNDSLRNDMRLNNINNIEINFSIDTISAKWESMLKNKCIAKNSDII